MERTYSFSISPMDTVSLRPQVRDALERYSEILSRRQHPKMWELTDKINSVPKVSQAISDKRRRRRTVLGLMNWLLSLVLLLPGLMEPQALLTPLLVGAICFGIGTVILWRNLRAVLAILSMPLGLLLLLGACNNPKTLGCFLIFSLILLALGAAALITRRRAPRDPYDRAAGKLLEGRENPELRVLRVLFDSDGMVITHVAAQEHHRVPYSEMAMILETKDRLLPITDEVIVTLQKQDQCTGMLTDLREWLQEQTEYYIL